MGLAGKSLTTNMYNSINSVSQLSELHEFGDATHFEFMQSCTEMVLVTGGSTEESIFRAQTYDYNGTLEYCQKYYNITPRSHWITTEFGGHVSPP